jgi:hypothetical protein
VLLGTSPSNAVVAAADLDQLLELVVHESIERIRQRDRVKIARCPSERPLTVNLPVKRQE